MSLSEMDIPLIDAWQRGFPLVDRPYREMAIAHGLTEAELLTTLTRLRDDGVLSRVGAVVRPNTVGASTLAAMQVPAERLEEVAHVVSADPGVNHNYEREHDYNLWFVVTGPHRSSIDATLLRLEHQTGCQPLDLPLERPYFIDLGFAVGSSGGERPKPRRAPVREATRDDRDILTALENGLPLEARPYQSIGTQLGMDESHVIERLGTLIDDGIISRFGLVVRHRELGYRANAMVVWDVPERHVDALGETFASHPFVTLCYRRPRRLPSWPYNLFCMIHGRQRETVLGQIDKLKAVADVVERPPAILFSRRRFKQRGARLSAA